MRPMLQRQATKQDNWEYQRLDQTAAAACAFAPAIMWVAEMVHLREWGWFRGSISSYHDVVPPGAFFIPLTVAVMIFITNGVVVENHQVHVMMGLYLLGVILFDHDGATTIPHFFFAGYFFVTASLLDLTRDDEINWSWRRWLGEWLTLPWVLLWSNVKDFRAQWPRVAVVLLPFIVLGGIAWLVPDFRERWLFIAEWLALIAVVAQYLAHAADHEHHASH